jgi:TPR repeat protein
VKYYRLAADRRYAKAQFQYGICLAKGEGVSKNQEEATKYRVVKK